MFEYDETILNDFDAATDYEWLETNGVGGWASSTITFANTRRYHGLLVAGSLVRPERTVLVSKVDETVISDGASTEIGCNSFPGVVHPQGHTHLNRFRKDLFPVAEYVIGDVRLTKTIVAPRGENTTIVLYEITSGSQPVQLELRFFLAGRDYHSLLHEHSAYAPPDVHIEIEGASFTAEPQWYRNFQYARERERGLDDREDLYMPGVYRVALEPGVVLAVTVSSEGLRGRDPLVLVQEERARRERVASGVEEPFVRSMLLAADQFVVDREAGLKTVIAGYHWFTDWGRDTMISLAGLCLVTRRHGDAKAILRRFLAVTSKGMTPNRFAEGSETPAYNSVDAGLWLFVAVWQYFDHSWDADFVRDEALPVLLDMIAWMDRGTRFNIHVDEDGLLFAGAGGVQLTWMDAMVGDWVVTPRRGKPVEINALWYNALRIVARLTGSEVFLARAAAVREAFMLQFWNEDLGCLFDVVNPVDASVRPNQLLAMSLPFPIVEGDPAESILRVCEAKLLTPAGLRSLSPDDPRYIGHMVGDQYARDGAYHQGTVWPWLLGPYITALVRTRGAEGRLQARELLESMRVHLGHAGIGSISEVFDGDAPHTPRGCIAQAWSVAEVLRACLEDVHGD